MMDYLVTYGVMTLDVLLLLIIFYIIFSNLPIKRVSGAVKGILVVVVLWFIARTFNFFMAEAVLGQLIRYGFLAVIILFPNEFRKLLDNIGRRRVFSWNTSRLIEKESRKEVAEAVVNLARRKQGAVIVIAREDNLDEEAKTGQLTGETVITKEIIEMVFMEGSKLNRGAMIIRDDAIVGVNARLPVASNTKLVEAGAGKRHLAGLGIVAKKDSMAIVVSGDTGYITMLGYVDGNVVIDFAMSLREFDLQEGIDENYIINRIEDFLKGTLKEDTKESKARKRGKKKEKVTKEKADKPVKEKKEKKVKEKKVKEKGKKRGRKKESQEGGGELEERELKEREFNPNRPPSERDILKEKIKKRESEQPLSRVDRRRKR